MTGIDPLRSLTLAAILGRMGRRLAFGLITLSGCAHTALGTADVFAAPSRFVGQTVRVCGYMIDSANIVESPNRDDETRRGGLSIDGKGPLNLRYRGGLCVEGDVTYRGCATGPAICTDAAFDYGIRVRRVVRYG